MFGHSGRLSLRKALVNAERDEPVVLFDTALNTGPIGTPTLERAQWLYDRYELDRSIEEIAEHLDESMRFVRASTDDVTIWMSSRNAAELCGLMALASARPVCRLFTVDASHLVSWSAAPYISFGEVSEEVIVLHDLFSNALELPRRERNELEASWQRLCADKAYVRIVTASGLESAALDAFDGLLFDQTSNEWQRIVATLGLTEIAITSTGFCQVGFNFLETRIDHLIERGVLELSEDGDHIRRGQALLASK